MNVDGTPVVRIRTPHSNDVLCGRGGGINSHPGNKTFRTWVHERKEAYNLATTKQEKARVSIQVIDMVKNQKPPGRFLARDESIPGAMSTLSKNYWIEIDLNKAIAKTSQALREGAPVIRAQHGVEETSSQKTEPLKRKHRDSVRRKRSLPGQNGQERENNLSYIALIEQERTPSLHLSRSTELNNRSSEARDDQLSKESRLVQKGKFANGKSLSIPCTTGGQQLSLATGQHAMPPPPPVKRSHKTITQKLYGSQVAANQMVVNAQKDEHDKKSVQPSMIAPNATPPLIPLPFVDGPTLCHVDPMSFKLDNSFFEVPLSDTGYLSAVNGSNSCSKQLQRAHSLANSDFPGGEELSNNEDEAFHDPFADDLFDIAVNAESNPYTSAVARGNSFGGNSSEGISIHSNTSTSYINNAPSPSQGGNGNDGNTGSIAVAPHRYPIVSSLKSMSSNISNLSSLSNLSNASPLSRRLFGYGAAPPRSRENNNMTSP